MEVKSIGQGRQISLDLNTNVVDNSGQSVQNVNGDNNSISIGSGNSEYSIPSNGKGNISEKDIKKAVDKFNKLLEDKSSHVEYEVYGKFNDLNIKIIDDKTKEVIKEIPPKKLIDMIDKLCELAGVFVDQKA